MKEVNEEHAHQMFRLGTGRCADVEEALLFLACRDGSSNAAFSFSCEHRSTPGQNSDRVPQSSNSINMPCEVITEESSIYMELWNTSETTSIFPKTRQRLERTTYFRTTYESFNFVGKEALIVS